MKYPVRSANSYRPAAKVNPILVEEVTLNPEAVAKKRKPSGDKPVGKQSRAPISDKRPLKKASGAGGKKSSAHAQSQDASEALRPLPPRITRLTPQVCYL